MAVDNFLFTLAVQWGRPALPRLMLAGLVGKSAAALLYAAALTLYLRYFEPAVGHRRHAAMSPTCCRS